jgi:glutamate/tyrosine decarboxylase-like PLP-dependent enzyme
MVDYLEDFGEEPILQPATPAEVVRAFDEPLPVEGAAPEAVLELVKTKVARLATHLQHPGNFAYVPNSADMVGVIADALTATLNQNVSLFRGGPSAAAVELQVIDWIKQLIGYPDSGTGVLTSGGSMANLMGLALARDRMTTAGDSNPVFYMTGEIHSSVHRALRFLGLAESAVRTVSTDVSYRMRVDALEHLITEDRERGLNPCAVVASVGTIGSGAVDPLEEIAHVCRREGLWLHVDGAYGALAAVAPRGIWIRRGLAQADSVSLDPHKWLFVPIDASCLLVQDADHMRRFFSLVPEYLKVSAAETETVYHPMEHTIELSRRFRALKIWMVLKVHGAETIRGIIDHHLELTAAFDNWVRATSDFELMAPTMTSIVCFRRVPPGASKWPEADREKQLDSLNAELLERLNRAGGLFLSHCRLDGRFALRICITHLRSSRTDIERLERALVEIAPSVEAEMGLV